MSGTVVKAAFVFLFLFGLVHVEWIPRKLGVPPEAIPFGVLNIVLFFGFALWLFGLLGGRPERNPIRPYGWFVAVVVLWVLVALLFGYEADTLTTLRTAKAQVALLLVYFVPLALIRNERDFVAVFQAALVVHLLVGLEVVRSGVLGGSNFNDMKRGSGPFGENWQGADVAASYLAQMLTLCVGAVLGRPKRLPLLALCGATAGVALLGVLATYARGALLGAVVGCGFVVLAKKLNWQAVVAVLAVASAGFWFMPEGSITRLSGTVGEESGLDESSQGRLAYYDVALRIASSHPMGVGTGQVRSAMMTYMGSRGEEGKYVDPHNSFLQVLCEQGVIGLALFAFCLWRFVRVAIQGVRAGPSVAPVYRAYCLGMIGFLGAFLACNMFYANFHKELVMGTVAWHLGMLAVAGSLASSSTASVGDQGAEETAINATVVSSL